MIIVKDKCTAIYIYNNNKDVRKVLWEPVVQL